METPLIGRMIPMRIKFTLFCRGMRGPPESIERRKFLADQSGMVGVTAIVAGMIVLVNPTGRRIVIYSMGILGYERS